MLVTNFSHCMVRGEKPGEGRRGQERAGGRRGPEAGEGRRQERAGCRRGKEAGARRRQEDKSDVPCLQDYGKGQSAAEYINGAFNGQKGFKDHENCDTCGEEKAEKKCSECKSADYCDQVHGRHVSGFSGNGNWVQLHSMEVLNIFNFSLLM